MLYRFHAASSLAQWAGVYPYAVQNRSLSAAQVRFGAGPSWRGTHRFNLGITAIEFLLGLAAASVLLVSLVAGATDRNDRIMVNEAARSLQFSLAFARNQAISRRSVVQICPTEDLVNCASQGDWSLGWMVTDVDTQEVLRLIEPQPRELFMSATQGVSHGVRFSMLGDALETSGDFVLCHELQPDYAVTIRLAAVGTLEPVELASLACKPGV